MSSTEPRTCRDSMTVLRRPVEAGWPATTSLEGLTGPSPALSFRGQAAKHPSFPGLCGQEPKQPRLVSTARPCPALSPWTGVSAPSGATLRAPIAAQLPGEAAPAAAERAAMLVNEDWSMAHVKAEDSAKLAYLEELLDEVVAGEHRALLFCRSTPDAQDPRTIPRPVGDQGPAARRQHTDGPASAAGRSIQLLARDHRLPPQHGRQQRHQSHQCRHRNLLRPRLESSQRTPPSPCRRKTTNWTT